MTACMTAVTAYLPVSGREGEAGGEEVPEVVGERGPVIGQL